MQDESTILSRTHQWLGILSKGGAEAAEAMNCLIDHCGDRLERLTRHMLQQFPGVKRWEQTEDVLQSSLMRLVRALQEIQPTNAQDFFGLAALQIRRQLIDLARHYAGPMGNGANHATRAGVPDEILDPIDVSNEPMRLAQWAEFHAAIDDLPIELSDVMNLIFYQGMAQAEAADVLGVSVRTVQRRWQAALLALHPILHSDDDD